MTGTQKQTWVEEGSEVKGTLTSSCPVVVRGKVEGDLHAPSVEVAAGGAVLGRLRTDKLVASGELAGEVTADEVVLSGVVRDNTTLRARSLQVALGVEGGEPTVTFGVCRIEVGEIDLPAGKPRARAAAPSVAPPADAE